MHTQDLFSSFTSMDYSMKTKAKNLRAIKYWCYKNIQVAIYNLVLSSLLALTCSLLCSYPFSLVTASLKSYVFISLPNIWSSLVNPKYLFIVFNVIVAYLVGESKLSSSSRPAKNNDIYAEYVIERARIKSSQRKYFHEQQEKKVEDIYEVCEDKGVVVVEVHKDRDHQQDDDGEEEEFQEAETETETEAEDDRDHHDNINDDHHDDEKELLEEKVVVGEAESEELPAEELNRRVEEFIARINKQRWIEARMLICGQLS